MRGTLKKDIGVTLVALIITVIVMLILTTVTINQVSKEDGIISKSKEASNNYNVKQEEEILETAVIQAQTVKGNEDFLSKVKTSLSSQDVTIKDDNITYLEITFNQSSNSYKILNDGTVSKID